MTRKPLKDVKIRITDRYGNVVVEGLTNEYGVFLTKLFSDTYTVEASKPGYIPHIQTITLISDMVKTIELEKIKPTTVETDARLKLLDMLSLKTEPLIAIVDTETELMLSDMLQYRLEAPYPSGFSPFDPRIKPSEGWTKIYDFISDEELNEVCSSQFYKYCYVNNGLLEFNPPQNNYGWCGKEVENNSLLKFATAFKVSVLSAQNYIVIFGVGTVNNEDASETYVVCIKVLKGTTVTMRIDGCNGEYKEFEYDGDWLLLVVDFKEKYAKIYDRSFNEKASISLTAIETYKIEYTYIAIEYNGVNNSITDMSIDWIALQEGGEPQIQVEGTFYIHPTYQSTKYKISTG